MKYISGENRSVIFDVPAEGKGEFLTTAQISDVLVREGSIKRPMSLQRLGMILQNRDTSLLHGAAATAAHADGLYISGIERK